jgi:hypothetical protein
MHDAMRHLDAPLRSMRHPPHARPYTRRSNALFVSGRVPLI